MWTLVGNYIMALHSYASLIEWDTFKSISNICSDISAIQKYHYYLLILLNE